MSLSRSFLMPSVLGRGVCLLGVVCTGVLALSVASASADIVNWNTAYANPSQNVYFTSGGNGNFSINVTGGGYFMGCDYDWGWCNQLSYFARNTTGPLIRGGVWGSMVGTYVYAFEYASGPQDTTLFAPYP